MKVSIENLSLAYADNTVVRELDLDIADGESLVLLGQSGLRKDQHHALHRRPGTSQRLAGSPSATTSFMTPTRVSSAAATSATSGWCSSRTRCGRTAPSSRTSPSP